LHRFWQCRSCGYSFEHHYRSNQPGSCPVCGGTITNITKSFFNQLNGEDKIDLSYLNQEPYVELTVEDVFKQADKELAKIKHCPSCGQPTGGQQCNN
jgi:hypothetical protein